MFVGNQCLELYQVNTTISATKWSFPNTITMNYTLRYHVVFT